MASKQSTIVAVNPDTGWPLWGQPAVADLRHAVSTGPNHAYIFAGPNQVGKRTSALAFARALCCETQRDGIACGTCSSCRRISRGVFPDVTVVDLASQSERDRDKSKNLTLNIATVREVASAIAYRPAEARWRIVIVDDVETMQETAQEAFLKTLEEPPAYAVIILLTSELENLLPTIQSRCVTVRFGRTNSAVVEEALVASGVSEAKATRVAGISQGSIGWAFDAVDDDALAESREAVVTDAMQFVTASGYDRLVRSVQLADEFGKDREAIYAMLQVVQGLWRDALYAQQGVENGMAIGRSDTWKRTDDPIGLDDLIRSIRSVDTCIANLEANVRPRLALESMVLAWPRLSQ